MKKFFILFLFVFYSIMAVYAEYQPIPNYQLNRYKAEVENIINTEYPIAKKEIKNIVNEVKIETDSNYKRVLIEQGIAEAIFKFYKKIIDTTEKYTPINKSTPATDWYEELQNQLNPYLRSANVNVKKINKLLDYAKRKQYQLENKYHCN